MANKKEIIRDHFITIKVSKQEKELWEKYSEDMGINKTRLARNTLLIAAESIMNKYIGIPVVTAYLYYAKKTGDKDILKRIEKD